MGDAGNVEHQPVASIERGQRRVAGAPIAEARQKLRFFKRLSLDRDESGKAGARVGERKAQAQSKPSRLGVDADQPLRIVDLGDRRQRRALINAAEPPPRAIGRQTRQPEGEKSPGRQRPCP